MDNYTLDKSNGSQTAIVPKSTYKEIETQPHLAKITAILYLHNKFKLLKVFIKIPDEYKDYPLGELDFMEVKRKYNWANHLPLPKLIGNWKPKETNCVEDDWNTYDIKENEYYYCIENVKIVKNKKYKEEKVAPPVEDNTRIRRRRIHRHVLLRQETELNAKLEELQKQEDDLTKQYKEAQYWRRAATQELEEAELAIEEVNKKSLDIKTKQNEVKEEIKKNKIEIAKKNNKNGYVILAHDDYEGKEHVYGFSQTLEDAQTIAEEAVKMGTRRQEKKAAIESDFVVGAKIEALWTKDNKWYGATITKVPGDFGWHDDECDEGWSEGGKNKNKFDVKWTDGGKYTYGLELHQVRNVTDYNKFNSARIVDLDTKIEVDEYGMYKDCRSDVW